MKAARAGTMRHRVVLQRAMRTADGGGGQAVTWQSQCTFWASIVPLTGREQFQGMQIQDELTHQIEFRAPRDARPKDRFKFGSRIFNIKYVLDVDETGHLLRALVEEGVPT